MGCRSSSSGTRPSTVVKDDTVVLRGKKAILFGERDDIPGLSLRTCVEAAGAEVVYETTSCVV